MWCPSCVGEPTPSSSLSDLYSDFGTIPPSCSKVYVTRNKWMIRHFNETRMWPRIFIWNQRSKFKKITEKKETATDSCGWSNQKTIKYFANVKYKWTSTKLNARKKKKKKGSYRPLQNNCTLTVIFSVWGDWIVRYNATYAIFMLRK